MPTLSFKGKSVIETYHHTVPHHTLEFDKKLSVLGKGEEPGLEGNLIIEGDNLLALKALLPTHAGKVKCVYIDPPYNTGDEGWVYNDNLTQPQFKEWIGQVVGKEGEDTTRHDKWCCMIYPRLHLLKQLLSDDGAIFVSIDDNEIENARLIMSEVFGPENFFEQLIWQKSYGGGSKSRYFVRMHEYVLCYAKKKANIKRLALPPDPEARKYYKFKDEKFEKRGPFRTQPLWTNSMDDRENLRYPIPYEDEEVWPEKQWQWSEDRALEALEDNELVFVKSGDGVSVYYKQYLLDEDGEERGAKPFSIIRGIYTQQGTNELQQIFNGDAKFKFPKPSSLIKELVRIFANKPGDVVLDATGGSGTTGQSVLTLIREDKIPRIFVLIQQPFDSKKFEDDGLNICRSITRERVARVIQGYTYTKKRQKQKVSVDGLGGSFSYARLGDPLFGQYKEFGKKAPSFKELARYVFYTHTSRQVDEKKVDEKSGFIGETEMNGGTSFYLMYTPNGEADREVSTVTLAGMVKKDKRPNWVIYCEKIWLHPEQLREFERKNGKRVTLMLVPFELK
jgi:adenine-specific DNA-methyltransferase